MRLVVENIPDSGKTVAFDLAEGWARAAATEGLDAEPTGLSGTLQVAPPAKNGRVEVVVHVETGASLTCDRCGEPVLVALAADLSLAYVPGLGATPESEKEADEPLAEEDLDIGWYEGGELDLAQVLVEAVALQLPPRIACADEPACDARTDALLAAQASKLPPPNGGFAALSSLGGKPSRSNT